MRAANRNLARWLKVQRVIGWMFSNIPWMKPNISQFLYTFWITLMDEGIKDTLKPRWGAITFSYLNDGIKPTVWHTWWSVTHGQDDPYTGIYPLGAPSSIREAREREVEWAIAPLVKNGLPVNRERILADVIARERR